jgi:hypothetical protein
MALMQFRESPEPIKEAPRTHQGSAHRQSNSARSKPLAKKHNMSFGQILHDVSNDSAPPVKATVQATLKIGKPTVCICRS